MKQSLLPQSLRNNAKHFALALALAASLLLSHHAYGAADTWQPTGATVNWNLAGNWSGGLPVSTSTLTFGADNSAGTAASDVLNNDITGLSVAGITFSSGAPAYTMTGNTFNLTAGITNSSSNLQILSNTGGLTNSVASTFTVTAAGGISITTGLTDTSNANQTTTVNGSGGTLTLGSFTLNSGATGTTDTFNGSGNVSITGAVTNGGMGPNGLTYSGTGTLILGGANTYTGATTVTTGTLKLAQEVALYNDTTSSWTSANIVITSGATLDLAVGGAGDFTSSDIRILTGLGTATGGFKSGAILALDTTDGNFAYANSIANPNAGANTLGLTKLGTNTLNLTAVNYYTGATTITAGTLNLGDSGAITGGTVTVNGGTLTESVANGLTGGGALTIAAGTTVLSQANNNFGATTINAGTTLELNNANAAQDSVITLGSSVTSSLTFGSSIGTFSIAGLSGSGTTESIALTDLSSSPVNLVIGINNGASSTTPSFSGILSGAGGLTKNGSSVTQTLANTTSELYTGTTTVNMGTLKTTMAASGTPFGTGSVVMNGGALTFAPTGSGSAIAYTGASAAGSVFNYDGGSQVNLTVGTQTSVTYTIGTGVSGNTPLLRGGFGDTLIIQSDASAGTYGGGGALSALGNTTEFFKIAAGSTTPTLVNGGTMVSPSLIGGVNAVAATPITGVTNTIATTTANSTMAVLPLTFGIGSAFLGSDVKSITGTSGNWTITLFGNATSGNATAASVNYTTPAYATFLTYGSNGFQQATAVTNYNAGFTTVANENEIVTLTAAGSITDSGANPYSVVINEGNGLSTPSLANVLTIGNGLGQAGLIINTTSNNSGLMTAPVGALTAATVNFGTAEGVLTIYGATGQPSVGALLEGTGGVTIVGAGGTGQVSLATGSAFMGGLTLNNVQLLDQTGNSAYGDVGNIVTLNGGGWAYGGGSLIAGRSLILGPAGGSIGINNNTGTFGWNISGVGQISNAGNNTGGESTLAGIATNTGGILVQGIMQIATSNNIGGPNAPIVIGGGSILSIMGTQMNSFGTAQLTLPYNNGTFGLDIQNSGNTFTIAQTLSEGTGGFSKYGMGTVVLNGGGAYTGTTSINGGTLQVNEVNGTLGSSSPLSFVSGTLDIVGNPSSTTVQNFGALTLAQAGGTQKPGGGGTLKVDSGAGGTTTVNLGVIGTGASGATATGLTLAGTALDIVATGNSSTITTLSAPDNTTGVGALPGIYTGRIVYTDSSGNVNWATSTTANPGPYTLSGYSNYINLASSGSIFDNALISGSDASTIPGYGNVGTIIFNSFKIANSATGSLTLGGAANPVSLTSGGLLFTGTASYTVGVAGDVLEGGANSSAAGDLIVQQYGSAPLTIAATIANGTGASTLTKAGPGTLILSAANTYTGATYIDGGILSISSDSNLGGASGTISIASSLTTSPTVTLSSSTLPAGFGVGSKLLGQTVTAISGVTVTLGGNASAAIAATSSANWATDSAIDLNGGTLQITGNTSFSESGATGSPVVGGTQSLNRALAFGTNGGTIDIVGGHTLTISGNVYGVTDNGSGSSGLGDFILTSSDSSASTLTMANVSASHFSGPVTINGGTLQLTGSSGIFSQGSSNLTFGNNTDTTSETLELTASGNYTGIQIAGLTGTTATVAIIENGGNTTGTLTDLQGYNSTYAGTMINGGSSALSFLKTGGGTLTLTNTGSSYTGSTQIDNGILNVASLASIGSNSSIGAGTSTSTATNQASLIFGASQPGTTAQPVTATLQYTGSTAQSTDRLFTLGDANGSNGTIDASGSAASATVSFTNTGSIAFANLISSTFYSATNNSQNFATGSSNADTHNLTLTGSNIGTAGTMNTFAPLLGDAPSSTPATVTGTSGGNTLTVNSITGLAINEAVTGTGIAAGTVITGLGNDSHTVYISNDNTGAVSGATFVGAASSLSKTGTGSWAVTNANTYSGGTTVSGGTLYANYNSAVTPGSSTGTGTVAVTSGGTLSGTGTIAATGSGPTFNAITVANGGNLAPGGVQSGTTANGRLTLTPDGVTGGGTILAANTTTTAGTAGLTFAIGSGLPNSATTVSGLLVSGSAANIMNFNVGGTVGPISSGGTSTVISINDLFGANLTIASGASTEYILIQGNGSTIYEDDGVQLGTGAAMGDLGSSTALGQQVLGGLSLLQSTAGNYFSQTYLSSHLFLVNDDIVLAVPEPSTWALMIGGLGLLIFFQRRNKIS